MSKFAKCPHCGQDSDIRLLSWRLHDVRVDVEGDDVTLDDRGAIESHTVVEVYFGCCDGEPDGEFISDLLIEIGEDLWESSLFTRVFDSRKGALVQEGEG